jgi:predicted MFS family arabinose efflux permease
VSGARLPWTALGALGLVTIAAYGACYYSFSALIDPVATSTGWPAPALGAVFSAVLLISGIGGPAGGRLLDRAGPRRVFLLAAAIGPAGLLAASFQASFAGFAVAYAAGCGLTGALGFYHVTQATAVRAAPGRTDSAIIWVTIAGALASTVYLPLTAYLAAHLGWRAAIRVQAATLTAAFAVAAIFIPAAPASSSGPVRQPAGAALAVAWKSPAVRAWVLATLLAGASTDLMLAYQVPAMTAGRLTAATAASIAGARGLAQLAGRLPLGPAIRLLGIRGALVAASVLAAAAAFALAVGGRLPAALAYCLLGGISLGAMSALQGIYTSQLADPADLGMLLGAQQAAYGIGGAAGPALGAALLALTGSYRPVMAAAAAGFLASALPLRPFDLTRHARP